MRTNIVHIGAGELTYEIRNIVRIADKIRDLGIPVRMENIGDPVAKGEIIPDWMKKIVSELVLENSSYSYCPTQGVLETRKYLAEFNNRKGGVQISSDDIIFFNGLGDAITKVYTFLNRTARIITPSPTYTTHSSSEAAHAGLPPVCYPLDPDNNWYPDIDELRKRVKYNPAVAGILLINPDNPTGTVFPENILSDIVSIAKDFNLFIIADEIYQNLIYNGAKTVSLAKVIKDVPAICMKGISKEIPWPGARCGWIEVYNAEKDPTFGKYIGSILNAKMVEVCSTTLPQLAIPKIFEHPEYPIFLKKRQKRYGKYSKIAYERLKKIPGVIVNKPQGAFYMGVVFEEGILNKQQSLFIKSNEIRKLVEHLTNASGVTPDKRFVYYLLASTGICVVPLTSFSSELNGFRMTLLEPDETMFTENIENLAGAIQEYLNSSNEWVISSKNNFTTHQSPEWSRYYN
ncbi:MAG: pyridoxal phosphate-dependent aminotransferase [Desulfobacterales bacterium]